MKVGRALASGAVGAGTVTLLNEGMRRFIPHAPRLDVLGMRALARSLQAAGQKPPPGDELRGWALLGDLASNTLFYSAIGARGPEHAASMGTLLGLGAGIGAVVLPRPLGLGRQPGAATPLTPVLTVGWYLAGGLAAAAAYRKLARAGA